MRDSERKYIVIEYKSLADLAEKLEELASHDYHSHVNIIKDDGAECLITYIKEKRPMKV